MNTSMALTSISKDFLESPTGITLNWFMNTIPGFNWVWVAMLQANEQTKNMRVLRALELIELFQDDTFQTMFLQSEQALDWFGLCIESITKERNKEKRKIIKNILLWFTKLSEKEKEKYEIEKILDILNKITEEDISYIKSIKKWTGPIQVYEEERHNMKYLESLWLVIIKQEVEVSSERFQALSYEEASSDWEIHSTTEITEFLITTPLFKEFIKYITK